MQTNPDKLAFWLFKDLNKAIYQYKMIQEGDKIAVAVSGGKDSLTLLKLLDLRRSKVQEKYEIVAIHLSGNAQGPTSYHQPLINWLNAQTFPSVFKKLDIPASESLPMNCHRCSWNRKKHIFYIAHQMGCNVVALGHHADDFAQTTLLNILFHGRLETISPISNYFGGDFRLIRPMCYIEEKQIKRFAKSSSFPSSPPECIRNKLSQRHSIRQFLETLNHQFPNTRQNLIRAGLSGIHINNERDSIS